MNISVCLTVLNEENNISKLLKSLIYQNVNPDEIIIVDGGSKDKTIQIIRHFQKKHQMIYKKLFQYFWVLVQVILILNIYHRQGLLHSGKKRGKKSEDLKRDLK